MSIKKQYLKKDGVCKVTFSLKDKNGKIEYVRILGDFNNWNRYCKPMKKFKNSSFSQAINLESGKVYQFRYLVNDSFWDKEPEPDSFVSNSIRIRNINSSIMT